MVIMSMSTEEDISQTINSLLTDPTATARVFEEVKAGLIKFAPKLVSCIIVFVLGYLFIKIILKIVKNILKKYNVDKTYHYAVKISVKALLYFVLVLACIGTLGMSVAPLITALGAIGVVVSLAVQDSFANLAGGVFLLFNRPFSVGDFIESKDISGTVKEIRMVYTVLNTPDNREVFVPNADFSKSVIQNYSLQRYRRISISFYIPAHADIQRTKAVMKDVIGRNSLALSEPAPVILVTDNTYRHLVITCHVYANREDILTLKDELFTAITAELE